MAARDGAVKEAGRLADPAFEPRWRVASGVFRRMTRLSALISLGAGPHQLPLIDAAQELGLEVVAIDGSERAPGLWRVLWPVLESTHDTDAVVEELRELEDDVDFKGVVCRSTGKALETAVVLARTFGLRGLTSEVVDIG